VALIIINGINSMEEKEIWVGIKGFEKTHEVSSFGRFKSLARTTSFTRGFSGKVFNKNFKETIIKVHVDVCDNIYCVQITFCIDGIKNRFMAGRIILESFYPDVSSSKKVVMYKDLDRKNLRLDNLYWGTKSEQGEESYLESGRKTSDYVGVHCNKRGKFVARAVINGKIHHVGTFDHDLYASRAREYYIDEQMEILNNIKEPILKTFDTSEYISPLDGWRSLTEPYFGLYEYNPFTSHIRSVRTGKVCDSVSQYLVVIDKDGVSRQVKKRVLLAEAAVFNPNNYKYVINIDGNKNNNSISNLAWSKINSHSGRASTSGLLGVHYDWGNNVYNARYGNKYVGSFKTAELAKEARDKYISEL
jgi:hypothetical protein